MAEPQPLVLVADDEPVTLKALAAALGQDFAVRMAANGTDALALARRPPCPDAILLDVAMPDMDGYAVCAALKAEALTADIPVLFVTARADAASETRALAAGAADFLHKPVNPDVVRARVRLHHELARYRHRLEDLVRARTLKVHRQAQMLQLSFDAIVLWRLDGGAELWNHGAEETYGFTAIEAAGRVVHELLHTEFPVPWAEIETQLRETGRWEGELHQRTKDGRTIIVAARQRLVRGPDGIARVLETDRDVTDRRRAEEAAREHLEEAARLQRLQTAEALATQLAHELNQPLTTITAYAEVGRQLLERAAPDPVRLADTLERIGRQAIRAGDIIHHLRRLVSRGRADPLPMDLNETVASACELLASTARRSGIGLLMEPTRALPPVLGVRVQVEQVLLNLLRNAFDAIADAGMDGGTVTVWTRRAGTMARVTVRDTGPGIDADTAAGLFEPLASRKTHGLGVGLRISRSLIEAHGGRLWAEAETPGGLFHFELPLAP